MRRIIGIISGKGGVGKTTLALNLGLAIHQFDEESIVVDCDLKNSNLGIHLGMYDFPITIHDVLDRNINLYEALHIHSSGLRIIPASISLDYFNVDPTYIKDIFDELNAFVLIDSAPGLGKEVISVIDSSDELLIVTNPEIPALSNAMKLIQILNGLNKRITGIVVNKVRGKPYEIKPMEIESICGVPVIGIVPEDENIRKSLSVKQPVVAYKPFSPASIAFKKIAAKIIEKDYKPPKFLFLRRALNL